LPVKYGQAFIVELRNRITLATLFKLFWKNFSKIHQKKKSMQIRHLQTFVCIARNGSFSQAAEILNVAQPALSQQIRQLEEEVGALLFIRHARGAKLSHAGERMLPGAETILLHAADLKLLMQTEANTVSGDVRLGLPTTVATLLGRPIAVRAHAAHPSINLQLVEAMSGHLCDWLAKGKIDAALLYDPSFYPNFPSGMTLRPMVQEAFSLILPPTLSVGTLPLKLTNFSHLHFVFPRRLHAIRTLIDQFITEGDINLRLARDVDSLGTLVEMVEEGYGTILPSVAVADKLERGLLRAYDLTPAPSRRLNLVWSEQKPDALATAAIIDVVMETVRSTVESGRWAATIL
jgi:LysR family nitrogen assimilation transcriptional regulator